MTESDAFKRRDYLAQHGEALIDQGYTVVPIQQGKKSPGFDGWQKSKASKDTVRDWVNDGFKNAGVGILTKFTCAIDIDCLDEATAEKFSSWCLQHIGHAPRRIGKAPKILLVYRTTEPFRKRRTTKYSDEWGDPQQIEVLGDGQQFVAFHIHPDTQKPYTWVDRSPLDLRATDLTEVHQSQIDELIKAFEEHAKEQEWKVLKASRSSPGGPAADDVWSEDTAPITISFEELRSRLFLIPVDGPEHDGDYDTWYQVGMALYHQFDGEQEGFDLWNEWCETSDFYDLDECERHWKTFDVDGKRRAPLTARFILRLAKEAIAKTALATGVKLRDAFINAKDLEEWEKARQQAREAEIDSLARASLAQIAKERRDAITGTRTPLVEIKRALAYSPRRAEKTPTWAEGWVYDTSEDRFFHLNRKISTSKQGFDAMYDRQALTKSDILNGKNTPSSSASDLALNLFKIPIVDGRRYMPGRDTIFTEPNGTFANSYPEHEIPEKPEVLLPRDTRNIARVKAHIAHLLVDPNEQRMLLDWLAWVVQNPGKHVNYGILLQGVEGDGKTFFAEMMRAVMGVSNVNMANANTVIKSDFSDWCYGQCLCCIEEIRLVTNRGTDKWEAINKLKPFITNNIVEVHPKGRPVYNATNTTSYMLFSNYQDALPIDDNSRRYLVLFSQWQTATRIKAFKDEQPHYYERLYETIVESPGAIRHWLLDHQVDEAFRPMGDAPATRAMKVMVRNSKTEFIQVLDDLINEDTTLEASKYLVDITGLQDVMTAIGVDWPGPKALTSFLERDGYRKIGKVRLPDLGIHMFYSKTSDLFQHIDHDGKALVYTDKIRAYVTARKAALDGDEI